VAVGEDPWIVAVGGINMNASFGMGVWNMKLWSVADTGISTLDANDSVSGTYVPN